MTAEDKPHPLINRLEGLAGKQPDGSYKPEGRDRAALAHLRRGLGRTLGESGEMMPYVVPFLPEKGRHDPYFLVAALFASHPPEDNRKGISIGKAMCAVWVARDKTDSIEKRFVALLNANANDLPHHLRTAIGLIKAESSLAPLDYQRLLKDLRHWNHANRDVQRRWAQDFWLKEKEKNEGSNQSPESTITSPTL